MPQTITRRAAVDVEIVLGPLTLPLSTDEARALARFQASAKRHGYTVRTVETAHTLTAIATVQRPADQEMSA